MPSADRSQNGPGGPHHAPLPAHSIFRALGRDLPLVLLVLMALVPVSPAAEPARDFRPNILLLVAEDLSPRIGAFGDPLARTPTLDQLAAEGVRYTHVFTTAGVCAPSRAALILGRYQTSTGTQHMRTYDGPEGEYLSVPPPEAKAFPELLRAAGYFTYQLGKLDYQFSGPFSGSGPFSIWDAEDNDGQWADREAGQPFFGMVNFMVTHESGIFSPLGTWPHSLVHFAMQLMQARERWGFTEDLVPTDPASVVLPPYYPDLPELRADLARHYDNIHIMDRQVAAILERLERDGLADSTIVIWTTDHGDGLPRAKRDLFDSGLQVPMIIRWPEALRPEGVSPGEVDARLISWIDLSAAILAMAGEEVPSGYQGRNFLDPETPARQYVYAARDRIDDTMDRQRAVRDERYKYIRSFHPDLPASDLSDFRENQAGMRAWRRAFEARSLPELQRRWFEAPGEERLFDLVADPHETKDLSRSPDEAAVLERMRAEYERFARRIPDLSSLPESELRERFWPGGEQPLTAPPRFDRDGERVILDAPDEGASIEYAVDDGPWRLYATPIAARPGALLRARAVRYGWAASDVVTWRMDTDGISTP